MAAHFTGGISCLGFTQCGRYLFCSGSNSREVLLFDIQASASDEPMVSIPLIGVASGICGRSTSDNKIELCVLFEDSGAAFSRINLDNMSIDTTNIKLETKVHSISFCEALESVVIASGSSTKPTFIKIKVIDEYNQLIKKLSIPVSKNEEIKKDKEVLDDPISSTVIGPNQMGELKRPIVEDLGSNKKSRSNDNDINLMTLEERLESLSSKMNQLEKTTFSDSKNNDRATSDSLVTLIEQALQSGDDTLLEQCLICDDVDVIDETARRLSAFRVVKFLQKLISKFEKRPSRGILIVRWLSSILKSHTSYLISLPNLANSLSGLSQMLEQRLSSYSKLAALSGRLDLLMSQISAKSQSKGTSTNSAFIPLNTYIEEN